MRDAAQKTDKNVNTQLILSLRRDLSSGHGPRDRQRQRQRQRQSSASWHHVCCLILLSHIFLPTTPAPRTLLPLPLPSCPAVLSPCWALLFRRPGQLFTALGLDRNWLHALHEITSSSGRHYEYVHGIKASGLALSNLSLKLQSVIFIDARLWARRSSFAALWLS